MRVAELHSIAEARILYVGAAGAPIPPQEAFTLPIVAGHYVTPNRALNCIFIWPGEWAG